MSEISQKNLPNDKQYCGAKTKQGICKNLPMENGRCRLHGGLTPKKHPNHKARFNALKSGRYSKELQQQIDKLGGSNLLEDSRCRKFELKDVEQSYRTINHWYNAGLLDDSRLNGQG